MPAWSPDRHSSCDDGDEWGLDRLVNVWENGDAPSACQQARLLDPVLVQFDLLSPPRDATSAQSDDVGERVGKGNREAIAARLRWQSLANLKQVRRERVREDVLQRLVLAYRSFAQPTENEMVDDSKILDMATTWESGWRLVFVGMFWTRFCRGLGAQDGSKDGDQGGRMTMTLANAERLTATIMKQEQWENCLIPVGHETLFWLGRYALYWISLQFQRWHAFAESDVSDQGSLATMISMAFVCIGKSAQEASSSLEAPCLVDALVQMIGIAQKFQWTTEDSDPVYLKAMYERMSMCCTPALAMRMYDVLVAKPCGFLHTCMKPDLRASRLMHWIAATDVTPPGLMSRLAFELKECVVTENNPTLSTRVAAFTQMVLRNHQSLTDGLESEWDEVPFLILLYACARRGVSSSDLIDRRFFARHPEWLP